MFKYFSEIKFLVVLIIGCLCMLPAANAEILFFDAFSRTDLLPWVNVMGTWSIMGGVLQGSGPTANQYSFAFYDAPWTDYTVQGEIQIPAGSYGGGIGGRVNQATGAHYAAWVYPGPSVECFETVEVRRLE